MLPKVKRVLAPGKISIKIIIWVTIFVTLLLVLFKVILPWARFLNRNQLTPSFFANLLTGKNIQLKKYENRTNLLLLGIPGKGHDGGDLTDTMIFVSINMENQDVFMVSLPRDIWLDSLKDKINSAYHYGEEKKVGGGFILSREASGEVLGQPIHYTILIDFSGFKKLVDLVGGLDIAVNKSFVDNKYPIAGRENDLCSGDKEYKCRYETIIFKQGLQHMDGETALKFVRSRYAEGDEGTDFARSQRQQKIILAFQKKLLSLENLLPNKLSQLYEALSETIKTDLSLSEAAYLGKFGLDFKGKIRSVPLEEEIDKTAGFLINPPLEKYDRWVLVPKTGDFTEIHNYISCHIQDPSCAIYPTIDEK